MAASTELPLGGPKRRGQRRYLIDAPRTEPPHRLDDHRIRHPVACVRQPSKNRILEQRDRLPYAASGSDAFAEHRRFMVAPQRASVDAEIKQCGRRKPQYRRRRPRMEVHSDDNRAGCRGFENRAALRPDDPR
jgi:hypothetical protein